jgi:hypothetical protein
MLPNPYTPGQPARVLGGRARESARITERLERVAALGEYGGPLLVFHSPRGIGKTSLLRSGEREAAAARFVTVWISASAGSNLLSELVYATRAALDAAPFISNKTKSTWSAQVTKLEVQLGVPGAIARATVEPTKNGPAPSGGLTASSAEAPISALVELLNSAATVIRSSGGSGLVVFVDEVHAAATQPLGIVLNALQNLDGAPTDTALTAVFAGLPAAPEVLADAATFGERSQFVPLDPLGDADTAVALVKPAQASGVVWDRDALEQVVEDAGGYPYFVQLLGSTTWDAAAPSAGGTLTVAHVRAGYRDARAQLLGVFRARWGVATPVDKRFITAMVELMLETRSEDVGRADVAARMGQKSSELGVPRNRLIEKGIIEPSGHGQLRFTIPGFAAYVASETGLDHVAQLRELTGFPMLEPGEH